MTRGVGADRLRLMFEILSERLVDEIVHGERSCTLRRASLRLPADGGSPPLAAQRTTLPAGPTRAPVILVHGFAQNRFTWRLSRRSFSGYLAEQGFDVYNLELRGHGRSRKYGATNPSAFSEYVDDLCRAIDAAPDLPFVIGHSLGAGVGIGASTQRDLRGLVHLAGVFSFAQHNRALRAIARLSRRMEPLMKAAPARVRTRWAGAVIGRLFHLSDAAGYAMPISGWAPGSMERDLLQERLVKGFDWTSVAVWAQMARWAQGEAFSYDAGWRQVELPVLVIAGDQDPLVRPADARACFEACGSPDKEITIFEPFEHQVHWGHLDLILGAKAPSEVWPRISGWMVAR